MKPASAIASASPRVLLHCLLVLCQLCTQTVQLCFLGLCLCLVMCSLLCYLCLYTNPHWCCQLITDGAATHEAAGVLENIQLGVMLTVGRQMCG